MITSAINSRGEAEHQPAASAEAKTPERESRNRAGRRLLAIILVVALAMVGAFATGTVPRLRQQRRLDVAATKAANQLPRVTVAHARPLEPAAARVLPGNSLPLMEAALYARATGYVSHRYVDIGDHVQEGQLLAEISAPDIDDQLAQARANVDQATANLKLNQANAKLAKTILARYERVAQEKVGAISQQQVDEQAAQVDTTLAAVENAQATIQVNQALVRRFSDLKNFQKITAPFAGGTQRGSGRPGHCRQHHARAVSPDANRHAARFCERAASVRDKCDDRSGCNGVSA